MGVRRKKLFDLFWILLKSLDLCPIREAPRLHLEHDGTISLFLESFHRDPSFEPLLPVVSLLPFRDWPKMKQMFLIITSTFSNSCLSTTTSLKLFFDGTSGTSLIEKCLIEK